MQIRQKIQEALVQTLEKSGVSISPHEVPLEFPADLAHGDYATGAALKFAKQVGMNPRLLAEKIVADLGEVEGVTKIEIAGPGFINFHLSPQAIAGSLGSAMSDDDMWGSNKNLSGKKIMVEYTDPNPFKEFHIGHLMSNAIGESISRLVQFSGAEVKRANYQGDVGPHVARALWGKMQNPGLSWGQAYAYGAQNYEANKDAIDAVNEKVYAHSDVELQKLYDQGRTESLEHFEDIYKILGTKFDFYFFESETALKGLALVGEHSNIFERSDGAVVYRGEQEGLHTRVFITSKGLPTYETKELGLAELKNETWPSDISVTITAHEQSDYFAVVLAAMRKIFPEIAAKIRHVTHGMMRLSTGKMSSRTGDVITGESLLSDLIEQAKIRAAESRAENRDELAQDVAVAAVKYQILKQAAGKDIVFDRERALSLEGDSGPYLQYAHARTRAILERAGNPGGFDANAQPSELSRLVRRFPEIVERAAQEYEPHYVTTYLLKIASTFNAWYAREQILDGTPAQAHKVALTAAVAHTLKNGLWVLGLPAPEKM